MAYGRAADGGTSRLGRWTRRMIRLRFAVFAAWTVVLVGSLAAMQGLSGLWSDRSTIPGTDSAAAQRILEEGFGEEPAGTFLLVARSVADAKGELGATLAAAAGRAAAVLPGGRAGAVSVSGDVASVAVETGLEPAAAADYTGRVRAAAGELASAELYVTGEAAIAHDVDPVLAEDLKVGELYIAVPLALAILVLVFGTLSFLVPFLFAFAAIPATMGVVWVFAHVLEMESTVQNLVTLIGLGIAVDYSLLVIHRFREELRAGGTRADAVVRTMETAGRAVVFSGAAVAIGLALLLALPVPVMRGYGLAGLVIPLVSMVAALTLLPALLYSVASRLDRVRLLPRRFSGRGEDIEATFWMRLARSVMRHPRLVAAGSAALLVALAMPALGLQLTPGSNAGLPQELESARGLNVLADALGEGRLAPSDLVVDAGRAGAAGSEPVGAALARLVAALETDPEVAEVGAARTDPTGRYVNFEVAGRTEYGSAASQDFVDRVRGELVPGAGFPASARVYVGGGPAGGVDFLDRTYGAFPWLVAAVLVLTFLVLMRAFRSVLLPLKAILLNLLSIGAAYGLLVVAFKWGVGEPLGLLQSDQVEGWIPVFLFAMLFGLSMDYEVFLVSRMREEWDASHDNERAVAVGLARTGRLVTAAGAIMVAAFAGFVAGSFLGLQQFGLGLAAAILIDVTIVRALLLPSVMKLAGRWNWWMPAGLARVVRVAPSPLHRPRPAIRPTGK
ncbi:MAG: MMPL family transporter [Thermoleophilia bacterium]|nr:MMPL family transporter [Thermoleophilia bacterium]